MNRILIVEDEKNLRESLEQSLIREGFHVSVAPNGKTARTSITQRPDLVLLDWVLPDCAGIDLLKEWRKAELNVPIIFLTARTDVFDKVLALELGADDYMTKPFEPRELVARIRVRLRNQKVEAVESDELSQCGIRLCLRERRARFFEEEVPLTKMEFDLLRVFVEKPGEVHSREELLNRVWGFENYPTTRTVDTHVLQLRQKFDPDLFETVRGIGYRFSRAKTDKALAGN